ncbi:MAG TPA: prolyl oligopeptidase family serine peptidase [Gammaproteobacteria bacterium]|nr:prolyl oligopeptidase family serine peptidase [Gammaproteobacteria bacterium]
MKRFQFLLLALFAAAAFAAQARAPEGAFTITQVLGYPYPVSLAASERGDRIAWVIDQRGVRNIWVAEAPDFKPRQVTGYESDDGQELTQLTFSPDGHYLVYVRGGDHDANWPAIGNLAPDPASNPEQPHVTIWSIELARGKPVKVAEGDYPAISVSGRLAFIKDGQVWTAPLDGKGKPAQLFFDRGHDRSLGWSPDGRRLAFVSNRDGHAFIGIYTDKKQPIEYLAPSTNRDFSPRWSPDGQRVAFVRVAGEGGPPQPILKQEPNPWAIWVADVTTGAGHKVWQSPHTLAGSFPETEGGANLHWAAGDRLVFLADLDGWPHLYSIDATGGQPLLLTPGKFMVEFATLSPDRRFLIYNANTGNTAGDYDRRHLYRVPVDAAKPVALTSGDTIEWQPAIVSDGRYVAFVSAGAQRPPLIRVTTASGADGRFLNEDQIPADFPTSKLVVPKPVQFKAADGWTIHGQLFQRADGKTKPGIIFVHGGPPRQMLLGWHYMDYYTNSYAVNQYLANHGFVVLSVNYRLGIGHGHAFHHPAHWGPTGASEYQDVVAGAKFLQQVKGVDPGRIGIWGGSYGGYLTAMGLARNSDIFKAGVDMHGVHDWSWILGTWFGTPHPRYEQGDRKEAMKVAWESSPDSSVAKWKSPVLLIQGDDDRNVHFHQTIDLAQRLKKHKVPFEEMVIPNEIHGFLRYHSWLRADTATVEFFQQQFLRRHVE